MQIGSIQAVGGRGKQGTKMGFRNSFFALLFLTTLGAYIPAAADEASTINIASLEIPYAYEEDGRGVYHSVFKELTKGYDGEYGITFYPSARLTRLMTNRDLDCNYIATETLDAWEKNGISADELEFIGPIRELFVPSMYRLVALYPQA